MDLPVNPPILPMLSKRIDELPAGGTWIFEPKWDGFRALIFRDGDEILIQSRDEKSLNRYFPELIEPLTRAVARSLRARWRNRRRKEWRARLRGAAAADSSRCLAGEAAFPTNPGIDRVLRPALRGRPGFAGRTVRSRREKLESLLSSAAPPIHLTPATYESSVASDWFSRFEGAGLDGVMAKPISGAYEPDKRVMLKVKHERDCDCVVAGFRWHKKGEHTAVGSLLLGLVRRFGRAAARRRLRELHAREAPGTRGISRALSPGSARRSSLEVVGGARAETGEAGIACREARAAGATARTYRGSRCGPNWWWKSLTSICRARASVTWRSFEDGAPTRSRATAPMRSSKWFRRKS